MVVENDADRNYQWFKECLPELVKFYDGLYVVIKDKAVKKAYQSFLEAWNETLKTDKAGTFIIQLCSLDEDKTTQTFFTNRISFE